MITQLTKQQESKLSVYREKWINKMLNPKKIDLAEMIKQNNIMYEFCGLSKPLTLVARSPFEAQIMANIVKKDQVKNQVEDQVWDQVKSQVGDQVGDQVGYQVWDQVKNQVGSQVWDQVGSQVGNQVGSQVKDQVKNQVGYQVWDIKHYYFSSYLNYSDFGWLSSYDFFNSELQFFNEKLKEKLEMIIDYINTGVFMSIQLKGLCIVCPFPTYIKRNNNNDLHCEDGHCLEFEDGYKMYCLDGIRFDRKGQEELYWKIVKHELTLPEILAIEDIDQRAIALKYCNAKSIIDDLEKSGQAELIDEATKQASYLEHDSVEFIDGIAQIDFTIEKPKEIKKLLSYKLYKVIIPDIFDEPEYMLVYPHASVDGLSYWKGVDPETAKEGSIASIAKYHNMSVDEYLLATSQS
jgi:hypothetical protein